MGKEKLPLWSQRQLATRCPNCKEGFSIIVNLHTKLQYLCTDIPDDNDLKIYVSFPNSFGKVDDIKNVKDLYCEKCNKMWSTLQDYLIDVDNVFEPEI